MKYFTEIGIQHNNFRLAEGIDHLSCGKEAISLLLKRLNLKLTDEVYINSTFNTNYVSSCVTSTIFNFCKPSKSLSDHTKLIFIIHDFGFPNENIFKLQEIAEKRNIPIAEDCAQSAFSFFNNGARIGTLGDYAIYSLKKILPYNNAGILLEKYKELPYFEYLEKSAITRRDNYKKLTEIFINNSMKPYKIISENISPYLFPFIIPSEYLNYLTEELIDYDLIYWINLDIYSLPVHQMLDNYYFMEINRKFENLKFL